MKKAILTFGLFSLMMVLTSFTSEIGGNSAPRNTKQGIFNESQQLFAIGGNSAPRNYYEIGGNSSPRNENKIGGNSAPRNIYEIGGNSAPRN